MALDYLFLALKHHKIKQTCNHPTFGFCFLKDDLNRRAYIKEIFQNTSASSLKLQRRDIISAYIIDINRKPVYTLPEVNNAISNACISDASELHITLTPLNY